MVSELVLFQLSSFFALIGMTLGWRGVMTKFSGFYDLPTAWSQVFWGIVLGGVYAVVADGLLFQPYYTTVVTNDGVYTGLNVFSLMAVAVFASVFSHLLLRRKRVRTGGSQPSSGWALGLAIGGMTAMVLMFRMFEFEDIYSPKGLLNVVLVSLVAPRAEALITARHGFMMLQGKRWGAVLRAAFWRAALLVGLYFSPIRTPRRGSGNPCPRKVAADFDDCGPNRLGVPLQHPPVQRGQKHRMKMSNQIPTRC